MKKKRRIRSSSSTVKVGRVKKQKQTVKVTPVLFPGASNHDRMGPGYHSPAQLRERGHLLRPKQGGQDRAELPKAG